MSVEESQDLRIAEFDQLEEGRLLAIQKNIEVQEKRKETFDKNLVPPNINVGDLVLLFDSRHLKFSSKFDMDWMGPYRVLQKWENGSFQLAYMDGEPLRTRVNAARIKLYHPPIMS